MNILIASNAGFIRHARVMLYSLCSSNPGVPINVWFAYHGLSEKDISDVREVLDLFDNTSLTPIDVGGELASKVCAFGDFTIEIFYRILAIDLLPADISRILYLDVDLIVKGDLSGLYNTDISGKPFAVCEDISSLLNGSDESIKARIGFPTGQKYFNSGVMLFNLDYLRETKAEQTILSEIYDKYDKYPYPDQDVMNRLFADRLVWADWSLYNCHPGAYFIDREALEQDRVVFARYSDITAATAQNALEAFNKRYSDITNSILKSAVIVHYVGASKPWRSDFDSNSTYFTGFAAEYRKYAAALDNALSGTILILKGPSRYEVLREAADRVACGLAESGFAVGIIDLTSDNFDLSELTSNSYKAVLMLQASLFDITLGNGRPLVDALPSTCIGWIFDDVIYHYNRVANNHFKNTVMLSVDGCADKNARALGINANTILPLLHGGFVSDYQWYSEQNGALSFSKPLDIICPCTVGHLPVWKHSDDTVLTKYVNLAFEIWTEQPELSPRQCLELATVSFGKSVGLSSDQFDEIRESVSKQYEMLLYITERIRYAIRKKITDAVVEAGLNICLIGQTEESEQYPDNVTVCGPMDITKVTELIAKAKVLINPFPTLYEEGAHERIFTALNNGTVCFTPGYPFLRNLLGDRLEYIDINDLPDAVNRIKEIVNNYGAYLEPILDNAEYSLSNHTWEHRGIEIGRLLRQI